MIALVLRRVALSFVTLFLFATFIFFATEVLPGDALDVSLSADEIAMMPPEILARRKAELGSIGRSSNATSVSWTGC